MGSLGVRGVKDFKVYGFRVWGLGFRGRDLGFWGLRFRIGFLGS